MTERTDARPNAGPSGGERKPSTLRDVLAELREAATSNRDMGDRFERFIATYLRTDPLYKQKYSDVWLWSDWPGREGKPDTGIDIVAKDRETGGYCAVQCKFFSPDHDLVREDIDSFFTLSGKKPFTSRLIVSTTDKWSANAEEALRDQEIPVSRLRVKDLEESPIDWSQYSLGRPQAATLRTRKHLRPHQEAALKDVIAGFFPLGDKSGTKTQEPVFSRHSLGVSTNRDGWVYNFSKKSVEKNMRRMIGFYNQQMLEFRERMASGIAVSKIEDFIDNDPKRISWSANLKSDLARGIKHQFAPDAIVRAAYRPFCKQWLYFNKDLNDRTGLMPSIFPDHSTRNLVFATTGIGASKSFSALITDTVPNLHFHDSGQCFPLCCFEVEDSLGDLFAGSAKRPGHMKVDGISDTSFSRFNETYRSPITKEDIFYYVYGVLHSPEYKSRFEVDVKKMLPRLPLAHDFWAFSKAGRALAKWHLEYESVEPYPLREISDALNLDPKKHFRVERMRFAKKGREEDRTTIIFNSHLTLEGIPPETYDYVVNGMPALEWVMDRYQVKVDKDSQLLNDPNDWSDDPRYIVDLVKRIVRVSLETMKIVNALPPLEERR